MPYRPAFTKQSCKTAQRIERCPDKVRFEKAIPTAGVVGWGKEADFPSTGGNNAFSEIVRHARFLAAACKHDPDAVPAGLYEAIMQNSAKD